MAIRLPLHKTKIVGTIGPACRTRTILRRMLGAGLNVARLNFSHGDLDQHRRDIQTIRTLAQELDLPVAIMADLPGPKIRLGRLKDGTVTLKGGDMVVLTTQDAPGTPERIPVQFPDLSSSVTRGGIIFLNDGFVQLKVLQVDGADVSCRVLIGGTLLSHKGLNLPGAHITVDPVTDHDLELVRFGLAAGVDAFCVSFAREAADIDKVRSFAASLGKQVPVLAKIERREAIENIDAILAAADGIMVARGDLGVEIPIEQVPLVQKRIIFKANLAGKPVITATQMLESMTGNIRPTRAEVTDVANAILDGTDAVMLSEETAIGAYPAQAVAMMAKIARETERARGSLTAGKLVSEAVRSAVSRRGASTEDVLSLDAMEALKTLQIRCVLAPTASGGTARRIARYKAGTWVIALSPHASTCNFLSLSYGVYPCRFPAIEDDEKIITDMRRQGLIASGDKVLITRHLPTESVGKINSLKIVTLA